MHTHLFLYVAETIVVVFFTAATKKNLWDLTRKLQILMQCNLFTYASTNW